MAHSSGSTRYCKAELLKDGILGTLRIPQKSAAHSPQMTFAFFLTNEQLIFVEDTGNLRQWMEKQKDSIHQVFSPDQLLQVMELLAENDTLYLLHLEKELGDQEDSLLKDISSDH